jgi:hypothetical protein
LATVDFLFNQYLPRLAESGYRPECLKGEHQAAAVVILDALDIGLPSRLTNRLQVYVYSRARHEKLLGQIAEKILEKNDFSLKINTLILIDAFRGRAAAEQLSQTINLLAADKPLYRVYRSPNRALLIEPYSLTAGQHDD